MCFTWTIPWKRFGWRYTSLASLADSVVKVRSKNAGPFWLTVDIFCGDRERFEQVAATLSDRQVAEVFGAEVQLVKRFAMPELAVLKFSLPRPTAQGAPEDRDMHGASWAALLGEIEVG